MRRAGIALLLLTPALAGCLGGDGDALDPAAASSESYTAELDLLGDGAFRLSVPVDVVLIGFENGTDKALQDQLTPELVHHTSMSFERWEDWRLIDQPHRFEADYRVHAMGPGFTDAFWSFVTKHEVPSNEPDLFDANAAESYLADHLPEAGIELDPGRPTLVMLHANGTLPDGHAWHIAYPTGQLDGVRHFGEQTSLVVHDMSARPDPYVGAAASNGFTPQRALEPEPRPYNVPTAADGAEVVDALERYVRDATHHRALQGSSYPVSVRPCHDVTVLFAVDTATLAGKAPGWRSPEAWLDAQLLERGFVNLTGDDVRVTVNTLLLPQDDPTLSALTRVATYNAPTWDVLRLYLHDNWARFTDTRPGCEAYLDLAYFGDLGTGAQAGGGFAIYDVDNDHRVSYSVMPDPQRLFYKAQDATGVGARDHSNHLNAVISHETGHLFGLNHPQNVWDGEENSVMNAVESAHTTMSYQVSDRSTELGAVDHATWQRNRAGFAIWRAHQLGLANTTAYDTAVDALEGHNWSQVQATLEPHIQGAADLFGEEEGPRFTWYEQLPRGLFP